MADISQLTDLASAITTMQGSTTKEKKTTKTDVSDAGVAEILDQILSAPGGVKDIGASARRAGIYDDTTSDLLLGEAYASAANKAELARSPTTVTGEMVTPGADMASLAGTLALTSAGNALFKKLTADTAATAGANLVSGAAPAASSAVSAASLAGGAPVVEGIGTMSGVTLGTAPNAAAIAGTDVAAGAAGANAGASGLLSNSNLMGGAGGILSGLLQGRDAANDPASLATTAAMGAMYGGPVGALVAAGGQVVGGLLSGSGSFSPVKGIKTGIKSIGKIFGF